MSAEEYEGWRIYNRFHPIGDDRLEQMIAILCSLFATVHAKKGKDFSPSDFIPKYGWTKKDWETATRIKANKKLIAYFEGLSGAGKGGRFTKPA